MDENDSIGLLTFSAYELLMSRNHVRVSSWLHQWFFTFVSYSMKLRMAVEENRICTWSDVTQSNVIQMAQNLLSPLVRSTIIIFVTCSHVHFRSQTLTKRTCSQRQSTTIYTAHTSFFFINHNLSVLLMTDNFSLT